MQRKDLQPQHDGGSSITQDSVRPNRDGPGRPAKPYNFGDDVGSDKGPSPSKEAPASQPKKQEY